MEQCLSSYKRVYMERIIEFNGVEPLGEVEPLELNK